MLRLFKISFGIIFIAMILMLTFIWFKKNDAFMVRAAKVQGNEFLSTNEILELASIDYSKDLFEINLKEIEDRIRTSPMIEKARVTRYFPSGLRIKVKEHDLIAVASGSEIAAVDVSSDIIMKFPTEAVYDLPAITGFHFSYDSTGQRHPLDSERYKEAVQMIRDLKDLDLILFHEISELNFSPKHGFIFYLRNPNLPIILGEQDIQQKLVYFSTIYHHLINKENLDHTLAIDIRFKNQVVVKQKT